MTIDEKKVRDRLQELERRLEHLHRLAGYSDEELLEDYDRWSSLERTFVAAITACIDMAHHILAARSLRAPTDYGDMFVVLGEAQILDETFAADLRAMAGFRNVLVHQYADVDPVRVIRYLREDLSDLERFRREVARAVLEDE